MKYDDILTPNTATSLFENRDEITTQKDVAFREICTESLSRLLSVAQKHDFAILTGYRKENNKEKNVMNNRKLRGELNAMHLGVHPLVGHWRECTVPGMEYDQCPTDKLVDVIERSYFVFRNDNVSQEDFKKVITDLGRKFGQDAVILKLDEDVKVVMLNSNEEFSIGHHVALGKIAQGYSQYVRHLDVPFVFEGIETPTSPALANNAFYKDGFRWY